MTTVKLLFLIIISTFYFSCKESVNVADCSITAEGIKTLCFWGKYEDAYSLYKKNLANNKESEGYLDNSFGLSLFSHIDQKKYYFKYLEKFIKFHGEKKVAKGFTNDDFYNLYEDEIDDLFDTTLKESISKTDSLIIEEYLIKDQEIRINKLLTKEKDSIIQIPIKSIIAQKGYNNKLLRRALFLLMRHASPRYLKEYKESGLLEHYASISLLTKEEYYSALAYKEGAFSIPDSIRINVDLLPTKFSFFIQNYHSIFDNYESPSKSEIDSLSSELIKYIEQK